jgi:FixJ family two-component response regulator
MSSEGIVYVVDDDASVRKALGWLVESVGLEPRVYASASEFLENYDPGMVACLVLDVRLRGMSGLDLVEKLQREDRLPPTILITAFAEFSTAVRGLKGGAIDVLRKPFGDQDLVDRIWKAMEHARVRFDDRAALGDIRTRYQSLSGREAEVLDLILEGLSSVKIGERLALSRRTVEGHRAQIYRKMGSGSLADLVRQVLTLRGVGIGEPADRSPRP